ncbi:FMN-dependent dehydrogenase-domain-containing protein [Filobasidium floriforme]|uniref:FMN-dependent dehydrogenase-domain-containing protein n=1 Tax=Filobasidium floriforme TaxID=5210 RepID=UPI001E8D2683|nr:FMN-dependent dehydrogenase-domain-containing protein [Filobasidium floriforme]KAH8081967.1 FMN-dependent dehydrogenase-domain-containing protein [Filobasidium floriforme]
MQNRFPTFALGRAIATTSRQPTSRQACRRRYHAPNLGLQEPARTGRGQGWRAATIGASLACGTIAYLYLTRDRVHLDTETRPRDRKLEQGAGRGLISMSEVEKHNKPGDLWVVIEGKVWDMTEFIEDHPGGKAPILRHAGKDATKIFMPLHPPGTLESGIDADKMIGLVDPTTVKEVEAQPEAGSEGREGDKVPLGQIIGLPDFAPAAEQLLNAKAWSYYSAGATDELTLALNKSAYNAILFRPRVMIDVDTVDTRTEFLGHKTSLPIFVAPAGMAKLSHPDGEAAFSKVAGEHGIIQFISTNASAGLETIIDARAEPDQTFFMQLYVDKKREKSEALIRKIEDLGRLKAIFVTVDAAAPGKREADERGKAEIEVASGISGGKIQSDSKGGGIGRSVGGFIDPKLNWSDIGWLRRHTRLPIGLKGIQTVEDAKRAYDMGCEAIYLSNHGGRALDGSPPALYTLLEINKFYPEILRSGKCEIYIDGGIRRGTDVVKALCLGAKGVGMGRPFMYALTYGEDGVAHAIEIMRDEIETTMRLLGVTKLSQLGPHLLNTRALDPLLNEAPVYGPDEVVPGLGQGR